MTWSTGESARRGDNCGYATEPESPGRRAVQFAESISVDRLGFSSMQLPGPGAWGPPADHAGAIAVLRRALELGVDHIDTSNFYGPHVANQLIREALHPYPPDLVVATKVGVVRNEWRSRSAAASPGQLREQVEENLALLGMDRRDSSQTAGDPGFALPPHAVERQTSMSG